MNFLFAKTAADAATATISAVRLPQPATTTQALAAPLASLVIKANRPATPAPLDRRGRQRAERARYHAQCRVAMAF